MYLLIINPFAVTVWQTLGNEIKFVKNTPVKLNN